ncbi:hypothetical protein [Brevundimonas sp.]
MTPASGCWPSTAPATPYLLNLFAEESGAFNLERPGGWLGASIR